MAVDAVHIKASLLQSHTGTAESAGGAASPPLDGQSLVIPVVLRSRHIHVSVHSSTAHHTALTAYGFADSKRRHKPWGSLSLHSWAAGS